MKRKKKECNETVTTCHALKNAICDEKMQDIVKYNGAVQAIKAAILQGQYEAAKGVNRNEAWQMLNKMTIAIVESLDTGKHIDIQNELTTISIIMHARVHNLTWSQIEELPIGQMTSIQKETNSFVQSEIAQFTYGA